MRSSASRRSRSATPPSALAESGGCRGIGNARRPQGVQICFVLAPQFQVLQTSSSAQAVIGNVQYVVGFVVRHMNLEQAQLLVDSRRQPELLRQLIDQADPAVRGSDRPLRHFVMDVGGSEHGLLQIIGKVASVEPSQDSPLACPTATRHNSVHSKSSVRVVLRFSNTNETPQNAERFRVFYRLVAKHEKRCASLGTSVGSQPHVANLVGNTAS